VLSDKNYLIFCDIFSIACLLISVVGSVGNVVSIKVFISMGLRDGVTTSFVFLVTADLIYLVVMAAHAVALQLFVIEKKSQYRTWFNVDPFGVYIVFANIANLIYFETITITTMLAVVRCMCVAMPLKFKNVFNRGTSSVASFVFCVLGLASYLPVLVYMALIPGYDPRVNATRSVLWISPQREESKHAVWITRDVSFTFASEVVVIVCVIVMARRIRAASRFRQMSTLNGLNKPESITRKGPSTKTSQKNARLRQNLSKTSNRELSVVKQVVLISTVYIVSNAPKIVFVIVSFFYTEFTLGKSYQNLYLVGVSSMEFFQTCSSSINIFIYYKFNTKFRKYCTLRK
ncbi:unnamed protein product, partial [Lymnaea stagnalis]